MSTTSIEWTDATWNPVTGCDRVSPGCAHCYALTLAGRLKAMGQARYQRDGDPKTSGPGFGLTLHPDKLDEPLRWRQPRMVFVNSMSDLFHEDVPDEFIDRVFIPMKATRHHTFQVLTKRPERMAAYMRAVYALEREVIPDPFESPIPNIWLGTSIENRRFVHRADLLRETPAAVRFISAEPLLGPLVFADRVYPLPPEYRGWTWQHTLDLTGIDWLIAGGESGPRHRPMRVEWVRDLRDAAQTSGTAFFFKQWGGRTPKAGGRELDGRTWDELPRQAVRT
ncbi:MAG: phage Gp37/Gp68 family protein [Actinomycetota bacterium]|nr:phage Gp37/Gp68 family protein [Actinomycetota bacterium]